MIKAGLQLGRSMAIMTAASVGRQRPRRFVGALVFPPVGRHMKVFISHSSKDTWVAKQIAVHIQQCGADTFLDESDIQHGDNFEEAILKAEETCTELVVLLTPWSLSRTYIWLEIGFFRHSKKRIVGILYGVTHDEIATDPRIAVLLKKLDLVDINNIGSYFDQLKGRVASGI